jgi:hypothetical protein
VVPEDVRGSNGRSFPKYPGVAPDAPSEIIRYANQCGTGNNPVDLIVHTDAPIWDGNGTRTCWVVRSFFAAFPPVHFKALSTLNPPVVAVVVCLVFRGLFEIPDRGER